MSHKCSARSFAKCPTCGVAFIPYGDCRHCSVSCYLGSALFPRAGVTVADVRECHGLTIKDAAVTLGVSYPQLRRKLRGDPGLRLLFPNQGEGRWLSSRGYAQ